MQPLKDNNDLIDLIKEACSINSKIQKFSIMPFYVATYSKTQIKMLEIISNECKSKNVDLIVYLDGLDAIARDPMKPNSFVQYYSIAAPRGAYPHETADPFPLTDFLTATPDDESIGSWLRSFKFEVTNQLNMWPIINVVVSEFCFAKLNAALDAFNRMDMMQYITYMYSRLIQNKDMGEIIQIRLCVAHLMRNMIVDTNKNFKNYHQNQLIKIVLATLHVIKDYNVAKEVWRMLCIILGKKFIDEMVSHALRGLIKAAGDYDFNTILEYAGHDLNLIIVSEKDDIEIQQERHVNKTLYTKSFFYIDFQSISNEIHLIRNKHDQSPVNKFHNPTFLVLILRKYLAYFPLWSLIFYDKPLSKSCVERYFSIVENICYNSLRKMPAIPLQFISVMAARNDFLLEKKEYDVSNNFTSKLITNMVDNSIYSTAPIVLPSNVFETNLAKFEQAVDNWPKKLTSLLKKKFKTAQHIPTNFEVSYIKKPIIKDNSNKSEIIEILVSDAAPEPPELPVRSIKIECPNKSGPYMPIIQNGILLGSRAIHTNTCAFDAFVQCLLNVSNNFVLAKDTNWANLFSALRANELDLAYDLRSIILIQIYGLSKTNCMSNITDVSNYFCKELDWAAIRTQSFCVKCEEKGKDLLSYMPIDMNKFEKFGIIRLQDCISEDVAFFCKTCKIQKSINSISTNDVIFGYVEPIVNYRTIIQNKLEGSTSISLANDKIFLSEIPNEIVMFHEKYKISSFINFITSAKHYVAYCCQNQSWVKYDDLQESAIRITSNEKEVVLPHLVVYKKDI